MNQPSTTPERVDRVLRSTQRNLITALAILLFAAATLIAHALRPGSLLSDWPSRMPWLIPTAIAVIYAAAGVLMRRHGASAQETASILRTVTGDEFRQTNLARAQRLAFAVVVIAQVPLSALALSRLTTAAAVTVMAVTTATLGIATVIVSFLVFDRE